MPKFKESSAYKMKGSPMKRNFPSAFKKDPDLTLTRDLTLAEAKSDLKNNPGQGNKWSYGNKVYDTKEAYLRALKKGNPEAYEKHYGDSSRKQEVK